MKAGKACISAVAFTPDGKTLAAGGADGIIHLWNTATGQEARRWQGSLDAAQNLVFSPDGSILAASFGSAGQCMGLRDATIHLWNVETGSEVAPAHHGHQSCVISVAFTRDGKEVVSSGLGGAFCVWDAESGTERERRTPLDGLAEPMPMIGGVSPDGQAVAFVEAYPENGRKIMNVVRRDNANNEVGRFGVEYQYGYHATFSLDGKTLACSGSGDMNVQLWDVAAGRALCEIGGRGVAALSPDGKTLAAGMQGRTNERYIGIWNIQRGALLASFEAAPKNSDPHLEVTALTFSPDGRMLASLSSDGRIRLWPLRMVSGLPLLAGDYWQEIQSVSNGLVADAMIFSPDGRTIAAKGRNNVIHVWETASGKERRRFEGHEAPILSLAFAPDGRRLASGGMDSTVLIWDVTDRCEQGRLHSKRLSIKTMESLWNDLADDDAARAGRAVWTLTTAELPTASFLEKRLQPVPQPAGANTESMIKLIADLDAGAFVVRKQAQKKLAGLGKFAAPILRQALAKNPSLEKRRQLVHLLEASERGLWSFRVGEELRGVRAVEVLEHLGTPYAQKILRNLRSGASEAILTRETQAALNRMERNQRR